MKVMVEYRFTILGGTGPESFADSARSQATAFFGDGEDVEVEAIVTRDSLGAIKSGSQYRAEVSARKWVEG